MESTLKEQKRNMKWLEEYVQLEIWEEGYYLSE